MSPRSGLGLFDSQFFSSSPEKPWYSSVVLNFKSLPPGALPKEAKEGHIFTSIMINTPVYLQYLFDTAVKLGATTIHEALPKSSTLEGTLRYATDVIRYRNCHPSSMTAFSPPESKIDAFVNATGLGARTIVPDEAVHPIRGQTVTVKGEAKRITTIDSNPTSSDRRSLGPSEPNITYVLPRPHSGTTILGGTKQAGNWNTTPDSKTTRRILENAKKWAPELLNAKREFDVVSVQVGLRPGRMGGARVELEELGGFVVCHSYGHAGAGYQNSVGSARKVVKLLHKHFGIEGEHVAAKL
jgi:D-amino-acid oxidase